MPTVSDSQKRLALAAAHTPGGFGGMSQAVGREFMHADQKVGRVGHAAGGAASLAIGPHPVKDFVRSVSLHAQDTADASIPKASHIASGMARGKLADGGTYMPPHPGFGEQGDYRSIMSPTAGGVIASEVPGRTDHIPTSVAADSYVIPADVVSGLGEGNTLAGARVVQEWLSSGPHGIPLPKGGHGSSIPHPPAPSEFGGRTTTTYEPHLAHGGSAGRAPLKAAHIKNVHGEVPVIVAGGEVIVDPHVIAHHKDLGGLHPHDKNPEHYRRAINFGHKVLDKFVVNERKKNIKTLSSLPSPSR